MTWENFAWPACKNSPVCGICAIHVFIPTVLPSKQPASSSLLKIYFQNPLCFQKHKVVRTVCRTATRASTCSSLNTVALISPSSGLFYPSPDHQLHPSKLEPLASPTYPYSRPPQGKISPLSAQTSITLMNSKNQSLIDKNIFNQSMRHLEHRSSLSSSVSVFLYKRKRHRFMAGQRGQVVSVKEIGDNTSR